MKVEIKDRAQSTIEFTVAFVAAILFLVFTCNVFVWMNRSLLDRQIAYEDTRTSVPTGQDFTPPAMDFRTLGGGY